MAELRRTGMALTLTALAVAGAAALGSGGPAAMGQRPAGIPEFLQPGRCYRIAFPIDGAPNYKLLELHDSGWLKAEVDAGSAKAQRQPLWINSTQIVTMRETNCSE